MVFGRNDGGWQIVLRGLYSRFGHLVSAFGVLECGGCIDGCLGEGQRGVILMQQTVVMQLVVALGIIALCVDTFARLRSHRSRSGRGSR